MGEKSWTVRLGGIRYQGRPLSAEAVRRFQRRVAAVAGDAKAEEAAIVALLRLAFPLSWAVFWKGDPVRQILVHPFREALLADFFGSLPLLRSQPGNPTNGTGSRPPIAIP